MELPTNLMSQSPRIGAVVQTAMCRLQDDGPSQSLNPLESGQWFRPIKEAVLMAMEMCLNPLESGQWFRPTVKSRTPAPWTRCLNPLESGQWFRRNGYVLLVLHCLLSQSPRIGAVVQTQYVEKHIDKNNKVSIPSNRGSGSDRFMGFHVIQRTSCLNPLESGQWFRLILVQSTWTGPYQQHL
ncbi:hypothetical protein dsmv_3699 [Desulfococcus multivorans DSM 2059]|uniref:Uncharacterized protein n=1 Tax=Desulfococcus multivorans DSM 2059 TaxID=1121405 RepID=S7U6R9_DESML|nr:hypothetical protein dsmv_3699 [Desulfococcus multivorans DSM 2059]